MSSSTPEPAHESFGAHVRNFFEKDVEPRLESLEGDVANFKALAPELAKFAASILAAVKAVAPNGAPEVATVLADAEKGAAAVAEFAAELGAVGL